MRQSSSMTLLANFSEAFATIGDGVQSAYNRKLVRDNGDRVETLPKKGQRYIFAVATRVFLTTSSSPDCLYGSNLGLGIARMQQSAKFGMRHPPARKRQKSTRVYPGIESGMTRRGYNKGTQKA